MTWAERKTWTPRPWWGVVNAQILHHETESFPTEADERLMVAAPELYDALVLAFDELRKWYESDFDSVGGRTEVMMSIRAALAKATGA